MAEQEEHPPVPLGADFQDFSVTPQTAANLNVPTHRIAGRITDSETGVTLADFTGPNAVTWPSVLTTLTAEQRRFCCGDQS